MISTKRTARRNATSGTPAAAHASTTARRELLAPAWCPSSTATAAAPCSISEPIHARWPVGLVARAQPGGEHELAALEQVVGVGHLDHVRPAQLATELAAPATTSGQTAAHDGQLQDVGEREHTNRHALSRKTRRCVHCGGASPDGRVPLAGLEGVRQGRRPVLYVHVLYERQ